MNDLLDVARSRRAILKSSLLFGGVALVPGCASRVLNGKSHLAQRDPRVKQGALAQVNIKQAVAGAEDQMAQAQMTAQADAVATTGPAVPKGVQPQMFERALAALDKHGDKFQHRDRIAIADFTPSSSRPRLQMINLEDGTMFEVLVAHGSGSDPSHSGFLHKFSNVPDSNATSEGAFLTANHYVGKHGTSQRLIGLDPTNNNAFDRAIVVHGAWYANKDMIAKHGMLGRSQGCFAVGESQLADVLAHLGTGRMIYSGRV